MPWSFPPRYHRGHFQKSKLYYFSHLFNKAPNSSGLQKEISTLAYGFGGLQFVGRSNLVYGKDSLWLLVVLSYGLGSLLKCSGTSITAKAHPPWPTNATQNSTSSPQTWLYSIISDLNFKIVLATPPEGSPVWAYLPTSPDKSVLRHLCHIDTVVRSQI